MGLLNQKCQFENSDKPIDVGIQNDTYKGRILQVWENCNRSKGYSDSKKGIRQVKKEQHDQENSR